MQGLEGMGRLLVWVIVDIVIGKILGLGRHCFVDGFLSFFFGIYIYIYCLNIIDLYVYVLLY